MTQAAVLASNASLMTTPSGTAPGYLARAWVNFNGTGTVAIRASGNVSSITDNGTGDYTVNLTTAMPDANYSSVGTAGEGSGSANDYIVRIAGANPTTSALRLKISNIVALVDPPYVCVSVFR
jgi:hypothetical protein